jgi:hypothetical protein
MHRSVLSASILILALAITCHTPATATVLHEYQEGLLSAVFCDSNVTSAAPI